MQRQKTRKNKKPKKSRLVSNFNHYQRNNFLTIYFEKLIGKIEIKLVFLQVGLFYALPVSLKFQKASL
jgi:hypothetical protein